MSVLAAVLAGAGMASSAAIAYSLSRQDDDEIVKLRRELEDARDDGKEIAREAARSIKDVRRQIDTATLEHGVIERQAESGLQSVRNDALKAIRDAERALEMSRIGSIQRAGMASDIATSASSIRADLDRLSRQIKLGQIRDAPVMMASDRAAQAITNMNDTQVAGDSADVGEAPPPPPPPPPKPEPKPSNGSEFGGKLLRSAGFVWDDIRQASPGKDAPPYYRVNISSKKDAQHACKQVCDGHAPCKAVYAYDPKNGDSRCHLYKAYPKFRKVSGSDAHRHNMSFAHMEGKKGRQPGLTWKESRGFYTKHRPYKKDYVSSKVDVDVECKKRCWDDPKCAAVWTWNPKTGKSVCRMYDGHKPQVPVSRDADRNLWATLHRK